jgi:type I restriction enzyme R subunit
MYLIDDFKFFINIRQTAAQQYGNTLDLKQHQKTIQNLLNIHVKAKDVETLIELTDIFNQEKFQQEIEALPTPIAQAEAIANRTIRTITEKLQEDEIFYQPFSDRLKEILDQIRAQRYQDAEALLKEAKDICDRVRNRNQRDDIPEPLRYREVAQAYYGIVYSQLQTLDDDPDLSAKIAIGIDDIIQKNRIINWQKNNDVQNQMKTQMEDLLFDELNENNLSLDFEAIDTILDKCVATAVIRLPDA